MYFNEPSIPCPEQREILESLGFSSEMTDLEAYAVWVDRSHTVNLKLLNNDKLDHPNAKFVLIEVIIAAAKEAGRDEIRNNLKKLLNITDIIKY